MHFIVWAAIALHAGLLDTALVDTIKENGIYQSSQAYLQGKLSLAFDHNNPNHFHFKEPFFSHTLLLKGKDTAYSFFYDDVWGYRCKGQDKRIWNDQTYDLIYTGKIYLYKIDVLTDNGPGQTTFFSIGPDAAVKELTRKNLRESCHGNAGFIQKLNKVKWYQSIYKKNKQTGQYLFIDWL